MKSEAPSSKKTREGKQRSRKGNEMKESGKLLTCPTAVSIAGSLDGVERYRADGYSVQ